MFLLKIKETIIVVLVNGRQRFEVDLVNYLVSNLIISTKMMSLQSNVNDACTDFNE